MYSQHGYTPKPCKYGQKCYKFQSGQCTFFHPQQQQGGRGGGRGRGGYTNPPPQLKKNEKPQNQGDPIFNQFCRFYQAFECTRPTCKKKHAFTKNDSLKRVIFTREMPTHQQAFLGAFENNGNNYLSFRNGNVVSFYEFKCQNCQLSPINPPYILPQIKGQFKYYETKENFIYFAYQNANTHFTDFGYYNVLTQEFKMIENAHQKMVTGIIHLNPQLLMSSSTDGTIKVWKKEGENIELDKASTDYINKLFSVNTKIEIMFINSKTIGEIPVVSAGTNDNRLLFWFGQTMDYRQIVFPKNYNKVMKICFVSFNSTWIAIVLIWNEVNTMCFVVAINLESLNYDRMIEVQASNHRHLICEMASLGNLFMVANVEGTVSIYNMPNWNQKIGVIAYNHTLFNMISLSSMTSTNIPIKNLLTLEKVEPKGKVKEGSFAVFTLTE